MKVLIVEDDDGKRKELTDFVKDFYKVSDVQSARSFQSGLRAINEFQPDFVFLDMTMRNFDRTPTEDGGRPHPFAGREILRQMQRSRIAIPVLVVTQFDRFGEETDYMTLAELTNELERKFSNYIGVVRYKGNVDDWKPAVIGAIGERIPRKDAR